MQFNSLLFIVFFPLVLILYWILPKQKQRVLLLVLASLFFYGCWKAVFCLLLVVFIVANYLFGLLIDKNRSNKRSGKLALIFSIVLDVALLGYYKYFNFIADNINNVFEKLHVSFTIPGLDILLPLGISFFTFKAISYLVDVYKGKIEVERNFVCFAAYLAFFPQIVAGPIDRASNMLPQLHEKISFDGNYITKGARMMLWGYFLKIVFANRAIIYIDAVYNNLQHHNGTTILLAAVLYSLQIYCDFAGYSLISIGCAKAMGIHVPDNFIRPYFATSITNFWKRWHISLTKWLTDYIYIPLGGSRCSKTRTYLNIIIVFLVSGIWHGAAWTFIFWGLLHGILQVIEKALGISKHEYKLLIGKVGSIIITFALVTIAWIFFRLPSIDEAFYAIKQIITSYGSPFVSGDATTAMEFCLFSLVFICFKDFLDEFTPGKFSLLENKRTWVRIISFAALVVIILMAGVFDDSQFIYAQF